MTFRWPVAAITFATLGNQAQRRLRRALVLSCTVIGYVSLGFGQASDPKSSAIIEQIMTTALSRCYSTVNGVKRITFVPATNQEFAEVKALGQEAVAPLAKYLDLQPKNDLTQLFAVKFLMAIGGSSTLGPLKRAFAQDQWEGQQAEGERLISLRWQLGRCSGLKCLPHLAPLVIRGKPLTCSVGILSKF